MSARYAVNRASGSRDRWAGPGPPVQTASDAVESFAGALSDLRHTDAYTSEVVVDEDPLQLGYTAHPSYPVEVVKTDQSAICVEGHLYGRDTTDELRTVAEHLAEGRDRASLVDWLLDVDGEFVIYHWDDRTDRLTILNDVLGRLPVYVYRDDEAVLVSREIRYILDAVDPPFDPMGIAQCLSFGFPLGARTLWQGVEKLDPASRLSITGRGGIDIETLYQFDFETQRHADRGLDDNAARLAELFSAACRHRHGVGGTSVVSLSGGHDSRAVAAGFHAADLPFTAATFSRPEGRARADVGIAEQVADALGVDWELVDVQPPDGRTLSALLDWKAGLNHLGMAYIIDFFRALERRLGSDVMYLTGDGGDKALPDLRPPRSFGDVDGLVSYLLSKDSLVFPVDDVVELTGVTERDLRGAVRQRLRAYPETDPSQLYKHFKVYERGVNWLFEGEDRNRYAFWSTTPFYSAPFFSYAMNCPDDQKAGNTLYRAFVEQLWPEATAFKDANYGVSMASPAYRLVQWLRSSLARYPALEDLVRVAYRREVGYRYDEDIATVVTEQLDECDAVSTYLSRSELERILSDRSSCGRQAIYNLFTVTSAIDRTVCDDVLSSHPERQFK